MYTGDVYLCICISSDMQMLCDNSSWRRLTELLIFVAGPMREPEAKDRLSTDSYAFYVNSQVCGIYWQNKSTNDSYWRANQTAIS